MANAWEHTNNKSRNRKIIIAKSQSQSQNSNLKIAKSQSGKHQNPAPRQIKKIMNTDQTKRKNKPTDKNHGQFMDISWPTHGQLMSNS
eukprot:6053304-Lingulodinium_polyedra.AAC.1